MTMSCQDSGSAWRGHGGGGGAEDFLGLFGDGLSSSDDLFELVWRGAGGGDTGSIMEQQLSCSCNPPLSSRPEPVAVVPSAVPAERRLERAPPSEAEMASWLFPIVCAGGGDAVVAGRRACVDDDQMVLSSGSGKDSLDHKLLEKRKTSSTGGRGRRSHHHAEAHSLTEKRRRWKINDKFKALQQLVPGCDNSNQASTLDQTILYIKSLQQQIQAMSSRCSMKPASVAVGGHIGAGMAVRGRSPAIIQFGPMFPLVHLHHPAVMLFRQIGGGP